MSAQGTILSVPLKLRANDIVRHVLNIDSRFRDSPNTNSSSNFYFSLLSPVRNILRIRIASVELPNSYLFFTKKRQNTSFYLNYTVAGINIEKHIEIDNGNYTADGPDGDSIVAFLNGEFAKLLPGFTLTVTFSIIDGSFTFEGSLPFQIDTYTGAKDRLADYGLGYYLGFSKKQHDAVETLPGKYELVSDLCANFSGDNYIFLYLNDYNCIRQTIREYDSTYTAERSKPEEFNAMAKFILTSPKNYMVYDDYANKHIKEIVFPNPTDITRLRVKLLDAYGEEIDLCSANFSFSMEVIEVKNLSLYNTIRDSLSLEYL
jgi:hypothetical protein